MSPAARSGKAFGADTDTRAFHTLGFDSRLGFVCDGHPCVSRFGALAQGWVLFAKGRVPTDEGIPRWFVLKGSRYIDYRYGSPPQRCSVTGPVAQQCIIETMHGRGHGIKYVL